MSIFGAQLMEIIPDESSKIVSESQNFKEFKLSKYEFLEKFSNDLSRVKTSVQGKNWGGGGLGEAC